MCTAAPWTASSGVIADNSKEPPHSGSWDAWLDGYGKTTTDTLSQTVTLPSGCTTYSLSFWLHIDTAETTTTTAGPGVADAGTTASWSRPTAPCQPPPVSSAPSDRSPRPSRFASASLLRVSLLASRQPPCFASASLLRVSLLASRQPPCFASASLLRVSLLASRQPHPLHVP